jgi:hypothetical protein
MVKDMRNLTDEAKKLLLTMSSIGTKENLEKLDTLYKNLEHRRVHREYSEDQLVNIVRRCQEVDTDELVTKYRQLLCSVQLAVWID